MNKPARAPRTARPKASGGYPWRIVALLVLMGVAVLAARSIKLPHAEADSPAPTPTLAATANVRPNAAPAATVRKPTPTVRATPRPEAVSQAAGTPTASSHAVPTISAAATSHATEVPNTPNAAATVAAPTPHSTAVPGPRGVVALTFDAGADRGYASDILDQLQEQAIHASFGITGQWAKNNPELVRRIAAEGHQVINHTLDHRSFTGVSDHLGGLSAAQRRQELEQADAIIAPLIGHTTQPWYRLPYGDDDAHVGSDVAASGFSHKVGWTVDTLGWRGASASEIVARSIRTAVPGAIYVLHVGRASQDGVALPSLIAALREHGFGFARIDEL